MFYTDVRSYSYEETANLFADYLSGIYSNNTFDINAVTAV